MSVVHVIGVFAVFTTTVQFFPQVIHAYRQKNLAGLSLTTFSMISVTATTWIVYGLLKADTVVILANAFVLISTLAIVLRMLYLRHSSHQLDT